MTGHITPIDKTYGITAGQEMKFIKAMCKKRPVIMGQIQQLINTPEQLEEFKRELPKMNVKQADEKE